MLKMPFNTIKSSILTFVFILSAYFAIGQDYYHGLGGQYDFGIFRTEFVDFSGNAQVITATPYTPGIVYKATLALTDHFALSAYPFVGVSAFIDSFGSSFTIGVQTPVVAEIYLGELDDAAIYIGGGFSYAALGSFGFGSGQIFGPHAGLGGQFYVTGVPVGLRFAYTHGINKTTSSPDFQVVNESKRLFTLSGYYPLGL